MEGIKSRLDNKPPKFQKRHRPKQTFTKEGQAGILKNNKILVKRL
jgi:hypothetical protein